MRPPSAKAPARRSTCGPWSSDARAVRGHDRDSRAWRRPTQSRSGAGPMAGAGRDQGERDAGRGERGGRSEGAANARLRVTSPAAEASVASGEVMKHGLWRVLRGLTDAVAHVRCHGACRRTPRRAVGGVPIAGALLAAILGLGLHVTLP